MNALYIGRDFHQKTRSSDFFIDLLKDYYNVTVCYPESETFETFEDKIVKADIVFVWQNEWVVPLILEKGKPPVVISMFDGVQGLSEQFWRITEGSLHFCFSSNLNEFHCSRGRSSIHRQFFPNPDKFSAIEDYSSAKIFYWERRPEDLPYQKLLSNFINNSEVIIVHKAPDSQEVKQENSQNPNVKFSFWDHEGNSYKNSLKNSNVYIAPRFTEGIGMSFLEAMAMGCCVVAHDLPTMNEYIENGKNGFLVEYPNINIQLNVYEIKDMGLRAKKSVEQGYQEWVDSLPSLFHSFTHFAESFNLSNMNVITLEEREFLVKNFGQVDLCLAYLDKN